MANWNMSGLDDTPSAPQYNMEGLSDDNDPNSLPGPMDDPNTRAWLRGNMTTSADLEKYKNDPWNPVNVVKNVGGAIYDSTIKPIGQASLGAMGTAVAGLKGGLAEATAFNPFDFKPQEGQQRFEKAASERVNFPGTNDNINWYANDSGKIDIGNTVKEMSGDLLKAGGGALNTAMLFSPTGLGSLFATNAAAGAMGGAGDAIKNSKDIGGVLAQAGLEGAIQGTLGKVLGMVFKGKPSAVKTPEEYAKFIRNGLSEQEAKTISNLTPAKRQIFFDALESGIKMSNNALGKSKGPMADAGRFIDDYFNKLTHRDSGLKKTLGDSLGKAKEGLYDINIPLANLENGQKLIGKGTTAGVDILTKLKDTFRKFNIKTSSGKIVSYGDLGKGNDASKLFDEILGTFREAGDAINARDVESLTSKIDNVVGFMPAKSSAVTALKDVKNTLNTVIEDASSEFGKHNKAYSDFMKNLGDIQQAMTTTGKKSGKTIVNGKQFMKKAATDVTNPVYQGAIKAMKSLESTHGIKMPNDIETRAYLSKLAEDYTRSGGVGNAAKNAAASAAKAVSGKVPGGGIAHTVIDTAKAAKNYIKPSPEVEIAARRLQEALMSHGNGVSPNINEVMKHIKLLKPLLDTVGPIVKNATVMSSPKIAR